jgi:hypothetical protein
MAIEIETESGVKIPVDKLPEMDKIKTGADFDRWKKSISGEYKNFSDKLSFKDGQIKFENIEDFGKLSENFKGFEDGKTPDFKGVFKELGLDTESSASKTAIAALELKFNESYASVKGVSQLGETNTKKPPTSEAEVPDKTKNIIKAAVDAAISGSKELGKFVLRNATTIGIGFLAYQVVVAHQNALNGCWKISIRDPKDKCKILQFTCNSATSLEDYKDKYCDTCEKDDSKECNHLFNPCTRTKTTDPFYAQDKSGPGKAGENCKNVDIKGDKDTNNCPKDGSCSSNCNCDFSDNCSGYFFKCVNLNWWQAAEDLINVPISDLGGAYEEGKNFLQLLLNILKYVAIVCGVLFIIFVIFMIIKTVMKKPPQPPPQPPPQMQIPLY